MCRKERRDIDKRTDFHSPVPGVHELIGPMPMPVPVAVQTTIEGETMKPVFTPLEETSERAFAAPPPADPAYGLEEVTSLLPIIGAIGAFVPVLFCWFRI